MIPTIQYPGKEKKNYENRKYQWLPGIMEQAGMNKQCTDFKVSETILHHIVIAKVRHYVFVKPTEETPE